MKTINVVIKKVSLIMFMTLIAMIFLMNSVFPQDPVKKEDKKKRIKVVIKTDKNGLVSVIDTTIYLQDKMDDADLEKIMKEYHVDLESLNDMEDLIMHIDEIDQLDSSRIDSICRKVKKIMIIGKDGKGRLLGKPNAYRYSFGFDNEKIPDFPPPPPPPPVDFETFGKDPGCGHYIWDSGENANTLSDLIGDIPVEMIKKYTVKEIKNGKRIIIEINDFPVFREKDKIIIIREPRHKNRSSFERSKDPYLKKKVMIDHGRKDLKSFYDVM